MAHRRRPRRQRPPMRRRPCWWAPAPIRWRHRQTHPLTPRWPPRHRAPTPSWPSPPPPPHRRWAAARCRSACAWPTPASTASSARWPSAWRSRTWAAQCPRSGRCSVTWPSVSASCSRPWPAPPTHTRPGEFPEVAGAGVRRQPARRAGGRQRRRGAAATAVPGSLSIRFSAVMRYEQTACNSTPALAVA